MGYSRLILNLLAAAVTSVGFVTALEAHPLGRDPDLAFTLEDTRGNQAKFVFPGPNNDDAFLGTQFLIDQVVWDEDAVETIENYCSYGVFYTGLSCVTIHARRSISSHRCGRDISHSIFFTA